MQKRTGPREDRHQPGEQELVQRPALQPQARLHPAHPRRLHRSSAGERGEENNTNFAFEEN